MVVVTVLPTKEGNDDDDDDDDDGEEERSSSSSSLEMYEILWKADGETKRLAFEANAEGFLHVSRMVQKWSEESKTAPEAGCIMAVERRSCGGSRKRRSRRNGRETNEKSIKTDAKEPGIATTRTERIRGEKCANYRSYDSVVFD